MGTQTYLIALGSNIHGPWGTPGALLRGLIGRDSKALGNAPNAPCTLVAHSRVIASRPLGGSRRVYANAVVVLECALDPPALLAQLKSVERAYGRRPGRRWGARPLDLDIVAWSGGTWRSRTLVIPHPAFRERRFVLAPLVEVAPGWRDPLTRLSARQLLARLDRKTPRA